MHLNGIKWDPLAVLIWLLINTANGITGRNTDSKNWQFLRPVSDWVNWKGVHAAPTIKTKTVRSNVFAIYRVLFSNIIIKKKIFFLYFWKRVGNKYLSGSIITRQSGYQCLCKIMKGWYLRTGVLAHSVSWNKQTKGLLLFLISIEESDKFVAVSKTLVKWMLRKVWF